MSIDKGTYMGGVRSIADIRNRCNVDEDTGCWHWKLALNCGAPHIHFQIAGKTYTMRGRRAVKALEAGAPLSQKLNCIGRDSCNSDCVAPDHIKAVTRIAVGAQIRRTGKCKTIKKAASGRNAALKNRKLTLEQVAEIRHSDQTQMALARKFGVTQYTVWAVRSGKTFRDGVANNSVFNYRPAA